MNAKNLAVILAVVSAVLLGGLIYRHIQAVDEQATSFGTIRLLSNDLADAKIKLDGAEKVIVQLNKSLDEGREVTVAQSNTLATLSNTLAQTASDLARASTELGQSQTALKQAQEELTRRDAQIAALTTRNDDLGKRATDLDSEIAAKNLAIAETTRKLESAEGDKANLQAELKRLLAEKAELEQKFNDIAAVRAQLAKLKETLAVSQRLEWIRLGLYDDMKGGQRQMNMARATGQPQPVGTNYDLNVEVMSDGSLKVIPAADKTTSPAPGK